MLKKLVVSFGVFAMAFGVFSASQALAFYGWGPAYWRTEDGKYELTVNATSSERTIDVLVSDVWYVNYNNNYAKRPSDLSALYVRLCNASTGNCTAFKKFIEIEKDVGQARFYNMNPGTSYVDIVDSWRSYYFKGEIVGIRL